LLYFEWWYGLQSVRFLWKTHLHEDSRQKWGPKRQDKKMGHRCPRT
jgi:hypothetical protein